nr:hypothetical protein [Tanacetum cinerariifolium]
MFANMRRVGKGFFRVETPLFKGMLVVQEIDTGVDEVSVRDVNTAEGVAKGDASAANDERIETSDDIVMDDVSNQGRMVAKMDADVVLEKDKDVAANIVKDVQDEEEIKPAEFQEVVEIVTTAKIITKVVTAASDFIIAASTNITAADAQVPAATTTAAPLRLTAALKRRKGVVIRDPEEELEAELNINIDWDKVIDHVHKKAKEDPVVKRYQALKRKPQNEAQARKNMMIYLKNVTKEQINEEESIALKRLNETQAEKAAKRQKLDKEKNQRSVHDQAKVKSWKLLESCGVQIITLTTTQLILLVERKYPLTKFTLNQMLNNVRFEVKEESEASLELLRFTRQQQQEGTSLVDSPRHQDTMRDTSAHTRVISFDDEASDKEDTSKEEIIDEIDADEDIALVSTHDDVSTQDNIVQNKGIEDVVSDVETIVITAESTKINVEVTQAPKRKGVMIQELEETITTTKTSFLQQPYIQDKGKGKAKMIEETKMPKKRKHQIRADEELAKKLQVEIDEEDRLARERELKRNKKQMMH